MLLLMKGIIYSSIFAVVGAVFLCVMYERISPLIILVGMIIGGGGAYVINRGAGSDIKLSKLYNYTIHLIKLIGNIFVSAIRAIGKLGRRCKSEINVKVNDTNVSAVTLANSITLTPESVALDMEGDSLTILMLKEDNND